jgi:hypothetical protein
MDNAKKFLARAVPWPEPPDDWWVTVHWTFERDGRTFMGKGRAFKTLADAAYWIERIRDQRKADVYVCMSAQAVAAEATSTGGWKYHIPDRKAHNAVCLRSLWLDIDVKPGAFADTRSAFYAFASFLQRSGMPWPTFIVMSGSGGFHAHWVLEDPIPPAEWLVLARALIAATEHFAFTPLDHAPIVNAAQLLRVPDTYNWKTDPPKPVVLARTDALYSLAKIRSVLGPFIGATYPPPAVSSGGNPLGPAFPVKPPLPFSRSTYASTSYVPVIDEVAKVCPFIDATLKAAGKGLKEPVWFESLQVAHYTRDPGNAAHRLSSGHAGYVPAETDAKLAQVAKTRAGRDLGWPQCAAIHTAGAVECSSCSHRSKGVSPFNIAMVAATARATVTAPGKPLFGDLPDHYEHDAEGRVFFVEDNPIDPNKPTKHLVHPLPMYDFQRQRPRTEGTGEYALTFLTMLDRTNNPRIYVPYTDLDARLLLSKLNKQGFHVRKAYSQRIEALMSSFTEQLWAKRQEALPSESLGWSYDDGKVSAFVYARTRFNCSGNRAVALANHELDQTFGPTGSLDIWKQAARLITDQKQPALDCIIAASFASPLVLLTGHSGMVLSVYSQKTGTGKTTACRVGQAVWANPTATMAVLDDTPTFINDRLSTLRHLPFYYDELRMKEQTAKFVNTVFAMGQGKGKGRSDRSGKAKAVATFATLLIAASNNSLTGYVAEHTQMTEAGIYRLFEFEVPKNLNRVGMIDGAQAQKLSGDLDANYGTAGLIYAQFLGQNAERVIADVVSLNSKIMESFKCVQEERFWAATIAILLLGARYANRLGITEIDEAAMLRFLKRQLDLMRHERRIASMDFTRQDTIEDCLSEYVNDRRQQTIVTNLLWTGVGTAPVGFKVLIINDVLNRSQGRLAVRAAKDSKVMRISRADLTRWLKLKGLQPREFLASLMTQLPAKLVHGTIASGAHLGGSQETLIDIDLAKAPHLFDFG